MMYYVIYFQYKQLPVVSACERWLEMNLVPELSSTVFLKDVSLETLNKVPNMQRRDSFLASLPFV